MDIVVATLREALGILKPAVPRKPTLAILKNILVKDGLVMATDMESMVSVNLPEATETFLLPYEDVLKTLQYVPGHEYLKMEAKGRNILLSWSDGNATFPTGDPEDYPAIPDLEVKTETALDGDALIPALRSVLPYTATETARPVLNGVTVIFGKPVEVAAGDGYRMAHIVLPIEFLGDYVTVLPAGSVTTLIHVYEKTPRTPPRGECLIPIVMAKKQIQVALDGKRGLRVIFGQTASVIIKLLEGSPPDWLKVIPKEAPILQVRLFASEFALAVHRVSNIARQGEGIVRLEFQDSSAKISAKSEGHEVSANISVLEAIGTPSRFGINVEYLTAYLKDKDSIVTMSWTGKMAPVALDHSKNPKVLIMPMVVADWTKEDHIDQSSPPATETSAETSSGPEKAKRSKRGRGKK